MKQKVENCAQKVTFCLEIHRQTNNHRLHSTEKAQLCKCCVIRLYLVFNMIGLYIYIY